MDLPLTPPPSSHGLPSPEVASIDGAMIEVTTRALEIWAPAAAEMWLKSYNHYLGGRPEDFVRLGKAEEVLEALDALQAGAYG